LATLIAAITAGLVLGMMLGLLGGGGGIIAIPVLLALGETMDSAATTSLVVVGIGAAAGLLMHRFSGQSDWRLGTIFGLLGALGAIFGSRLAFVTDDRIQLAGFIILLLIAAWGMFRRRRPVSDTSTERPKPNWARVFLFATAVGLITGFFGVGGGFVAVPALVLALRIPMKTASATALLVILINVVIAFFAHGTAHLNETLTVSISIAAAIGAVLGALLQTKVPTARLQHAFGVLLLVAAAYGTFEVITWS